MHNKLSTSLLLVAANVAVPAFAQFTMSMGVQSNQMEVESHTHLYIAPMPLNLDDHENNQQTNVGGELAAGYQFDYDPTYNVAIEIFGQLSNARVKVPVSPNGADELTIGSNAPVEDATMSVEWIAGVRMRPGYYVTPAVRLFLDGGVVWSNFELKQTDALQDYINGVPLLTHFDQSQTETLFGWRYGAGVEYNINEMMVLGLDYIITEFEHFDSDFVKDAVHQGSEIGQISASGFAKYTPTIHSLGLNFKVLFGGTQQSAPPPRQPNVMRDK